MKPRPTGQPIYPIEERRGRCYEIAIKAFLGWAFVPEGLDALWEREDTTVTLVQGFPRHAHHDTRYGHSWIEVVREVEFDQFILVEAFCWDPTHDVWLPREGYYRGGRINPDHNRRYTIREVAQKLEETENLGAWHDIDEEVIWADEEG